METVDAPQDKKEAYRNILGGVPDALFILSGGINEISVGDKKRVKSTSYADSNATGMLGGKARVIAASELGTFFPQMKLVTTSRGPESDVTHAQVMADELERFGVSGSEIVLEEQSVSTSTELVEMVKLAVANGWSSIGVLSNDYHIERIRTMMEVLPFFAKNDEEFNDSWQKFQEKGVNVRFISAEDVLPLRDKRYKRLIEEAHKLPEYKKRLASEQEGIRRIKEDLQNYGKVV